MEKKPNVIRRLPAWPLVLAALWALPAAAQVIHPDDIVYPPMPSVDRPQPERVELDNGMVVMLLEDHELPLVEARALIRTGARWEPADKVGLAGLFGQMLRNGGTESMPSDALDDLLEDRAAIIETSVSTSAGNAFMSCLKEDFSEMLGVFADVLRRPAFEEDKLAVAKTQTVAGIARQNDNAGQILGREFNELIYGSDSPYARTPTYTSLEGVGRDDLVAWHAQYLHPDRVILGLTGDFDKKAALAEVKKAFGDWPRGPSFEDPEIPVTAPEPGLHFVEKSDVNQSYIRIGHLGIERDHPDYYAVEVMNQVLGGSFAARLFSRVRSQQGLAYNVFGLLQSQWDYPGVYLMSMATKVETTSAGLQSLLTEARNMTAEPPTDEEVEKAKAGILNSFVFRADSTSEILQQQLTYEYYGYPLDWLDRYRRGIEGVTTAEVRKAAAEHIHPDDFVMLVVGPSEGTDRPLSDFGEVQVVDITIPEPEAPEVEMTAEGREKARELLARAVESFGGAARLDGLRSVESMASVEMTTPQGTMEANGKTLLVYPDRFRLEMSMPFGTMVQVLDGDSGFVQMGPRTQPLPAGQVEEGRRGLWRNPLGLLRLRNEEGFDSVASGTEEVDGTAVELVSVRYHDYPVTVGIDPETGRILSLNYRGSVMGPPGDVLEVFSDYRDVEGMRVPFHSVVTVNGNPAMKVTTESMVVNGEVDESAFKMPEGDS